MSSKIVGGAASPAYTITTADLIENGGKFKLMAGTILKVALLTQADMDAGGRELEGQAAIPIFIVNNHPAFNKAANTYIEGGPALPMRLVVDRGVTGFVAIPVYLDFGVDPGGGGSTPYVAKLDLSDARNSQYIPWM